MRRRVRGRYRRRWYIGKHRNLAGPGELIGWYMILASCTCIVSLVIANWIEHGMVVADLNTRIKYLFDLLW